MALVLRYLRLGWCCLACVAINPEPVRAAESTEAGRTTPAVLSCEALSGKRLTDGKLQHATIVRPPYSATWDEVPGGKEDIGKAFCRVEGQTSSGARSDIRFEVWLPFPKDWNGRLLGVGSSRSLGSINHLDLGLGINRGFAVVATDNGHHGFAATDISWAAGQPERVADFAYRAHHLATESAKELVKLFYGRRQQHAYFMGCSQGGYMGMLAAERFPDDYDGIVAGSPIYDWIQEMTFQAWNYRALTASSGASISAGQMQALYSAAQRQCAGADGLIADPRKCHFDPSVLQCPASGSTCLSRDQTEAVRKIYGGPHTRSGEVLGRGLTVGSESTWSRLWDVSTVAPTSGGSWLGTYRFMVFENSHWNPVSLDFDRDPQFAQRKLGATLSADDSDLAAFANRGGKLIVYHGWADHMVPAESSTDYHAAVTARLGSQSVATFFRLFMLPGMAHCGGGPGASEILRTTDTPEVPLQADHDVLLAIEEWVERGVAPTGLIALKADEAGRILRARLICAEGAHPRLAGGKPTEVSPQLCEFATR